MGNVMSGKPKSSSATQANSGVKMPAVIAAVVALVLFIGFLAFHFFGSHTESVQPRPLTTGESWIDQKARESHGDFTKLSQEDQQHLFSIAGPSAPVTLRMKYQAQQENK